MSPSYGGDIMGVQTPNIDRSRKEGLRLTSFYGQPSCTAGRAAFITGQLPVRTGLTTVGTPGSPAGLQKEDITLAEILKTRGYATAQFGKNHLGDLEEHLPHRHGFDEFFGNLYHLNANEDLEDPGPADRPRLPQEVRSARRHLRHRRRPDEGRRPADHQADGDLRRRDPGQVARLSGTPGRRTASPSSSGTTPPASMCSSISRQEPRRQSRAGREDVYGDGLAEHDGQVGQLLAKLDELGLAKNTIVIYTTDNGAYQYMWPEGGTTPFRGDKGTTWEGGVRVPCLIRWPGAPGGRVSGEIVDMRTCCRRWPPPRASRMSSRS